MRHNTSEFRRNKHLLIYGKYPIKAICHDCGNNSSPGWAIEVHHKDENHLNNKIENLIPVCRLCHMKRHYPTIKRLIPFSCGGWRKHPRIQAMVRKDILNREDRAFLESVSWGRLFILAWFCVVEE